VHFHREIDLLICRKLAFTLNAHNWIFISTINTNTVQIEVLTNRWDFSPNHLWQFSSVNPLAG